MIKKLFILLFFMFILSCGKIELVLKESDSPNPLKNNVLLVITGEEKEIYVRELGSFFGVSKNHEYILESSFSQKQENRAVKKNQVAKKTDYEFIIGYNLFYKNKECKILDKIIVTKFTTAPKSFGYNFGSDRSFQKLYISNIKKNIQRFIRSIPINTNCLK